MRRVPAFRSGPEETRGNAERIDRVPATLPGTGLPEREYGEV